MRSLLILPLVLTSVALAQPRLPSAAAAPVFDAERFFVGRTEGVGKLKVALSRTTAIKVQGQGRVDRDGTLILDQLIEREGKPPQQRQWRIRKSAPGRYTGTLTDASGPITGVVRGSRLELRYRTKSGGLQARQWLDLQPGGRTALNRLELSKLGIKIAVVDETIRKLD